MNKETKIINIWLKLEFYYLLMIIISMEKDLRITIWWGRKKLIFASKNKTKMSNL